MTIKERDAFTTRCLMILETARADRDSRTVRVVLDALAKAYGLRP
jgi:hypothetical protein